MIFDDLWATIQGEKIRPDVWVCDCKSLKKRVATFKKTNVTDGICDRCGHFAVKIEKKALNNSRLVLNRHRPGWAKKRSA